MLKPLTPTVSLGNIISILTGLWTPFITNMLESSRYIQVLTTFNLKHHIIVAYFRDLSSYEYYCDVAKHGIAKNIKPISPAEPIKWSLDAPDKTEYLLPASLQFTLMTYGY